jgi:SAM-dependent methyltransferase
MTDERPDNYLDPYREAYTHFGAGFEATLWGSPESQVVRFDVIIDLAGLDGCTVVDAGCGQGDLAVRLLDRDIAFARYVGIDAVEGMIARARTRELDRCDFLAADFVRDPDVIAAQAPDFVCISGALNTMDEALARDVITAAFDASAQGVAFNFLSDRPDPRWDAQQLGPARRFDTLAWLDWAMTVTPRVAFTQDYLDGHDATIVIRH